MACDAVSNLPRRQRTEGGALDKNLAFGSGRDGVLVVPGDIVGALDEGELKAAGMKRHASLDEVVDALRRLGKAEARQRNYAQDLGPQHRRSSTVGVLTDYHYPIRGFSGVPLRLIIRMRLTAGEP